MPFGPFKAVPSSTEEVCDPSVFDQIEEYVTIATTSPIILASIVGTIALLFGMFSMWVYMYFTTGSKHKHFVDMPFKNGRDWTFLFRLVRLSGYGFLGAAVRVLTENVRNRVYVGHKKWMFFGDETWWVGHPALCEQMFSAKNLKNWEKLSKTDTASVLYSPEAKGNERQAMLYTGDDERWRTARYHLSPYFYNYDFKLLDSKIQGIVEKHLKRTVTECQGETELLELLLFITLDLLCQVLYDSALSHEDLSMLTYCMSEYIVPGTKFRGNYPGGLSCLEYHTKVAVDIGKDAPKGTVAGIINNCPDMSDSLKEESLAFFLEALTPAFASFWSISNILCFSEAEKREEAKTNATFRQQCIKESLRMYPPVPSLFPRQAKVDQTMPNPIYNEDKPKKPRTLFQKIMGIVPFEDQPEIKIKKGTNVFVIPSVLHYDDRFWFQPNDFKPERWDKEPSILADVDTTNAKLNTRNRQSQAPGLLGLLKDTIGTSRSRKSMHGKAKEFFDAGENLRTMIVGVETESVQSAATMDQILEASSESTTELQMWSFLPFGLGPHTCMGRRLAIRMVDNIVLKFLEADAMFFKGVVPSLFSRKVWYERVEPVAAVYNFPADPVFIQINASSKAREMYNKSVYGKSVKFDMSANLGALVEDEKEEGLEDFLK